jgi:hypothetical protein
MNLQFIAANSVLGWALFVSLPQLEQQLLLLAQGFKNP